MSMSKRRILNNIRDCQLLKEQYKLKKDMISVEYYEQEIKRLWNKLNIRENNKKRNRKEQKKSRGY